jgi:putative tryptophan/tyrosine transport system substrate-binding protein
MKRRDFITLVGGAAAAWTLAARAQQPDRMRRIGVLMSGAATATTSQSYVAMFVEALRQLGWTEGQNLRVDIRWNAGDAQLTRIYAAQLIGLMPDVILAATTANLEAIQQANQHRAGRVHAGLRSGRARLRRECREARRQPHGLQRV